jgi:hypothetical protein
MPSWFSLCQILSVFDAALDEFLIVSLFSNGLPICVIEGCFLFSSASLCERALCVGFWQVHGSRCRACCSWDIGLLGMGGRSRVCERGSREEGV